MSATGLYVKACRCLYSNDNCSSSSWDELFQLLPQLRTALSCRVCRGLIVDPQSSRYCQHYVCRGCLKKKRALDPGCKWCLDLNQLQQSDRQVRVVLACYKRLCETIQSSDFYINNMSKETKIENLLEEAISNPDVLPDSSSTSLSDSNVRQDEGETAWSGNPAVTSRDTGKICARENVAKHVNNCDPERRVEKQKISTHSQVTSSKSTLKPKGNSEQSNGHVDLSQATRKADIRKCNEVQDNIISKQECNKLESYVLRSDNNNKPHQDYNNNSAKLHNTCSTSRNGKVWQSCEDSRYMKKRKFRQIIGSGFENDSIKLKLHRGVDQCWKSKPRKQRKMDYGVFNKKSIPI